ncbi:hypothetical protein C8J26_3894 [Sphingomonas aurantiaca]|uniref:O-antigen ligase-like membrane protein n=1 Tax=Sphingomonas aurantiaca TaxID=185949 RepID=A0A2T5GG41_9SPHN|nr:hypothetical protein [Sphingomonas aurantiaca]PTQ58294.1 hypothetical protein C8J26_3894 [Sphingomonas aurantiaca]
MMNAITIESSVGTATGYQRFIRTPLFAALLLGIILATPSAASYLFLTSSQAVGTAVMAAVASLLLAPVVRFRIRVFAMVILVAAIFGHFFVARYMIPASTGRFASSLVLLLGVILAAHFVAQWLVELPDTVLQRALHWLRIGMVLVAILSILHLEPRRFDLSVPEKAIFPFTEHSHFALVFTPLLLDGCVRARGWRRSVWLVVGLLIALLLQNLTVLIGFALVALITAPLWQIVILTIVIAGAALSMDLTYYLSRLDLSADTTNLSALVYIQGYEFMIDSFDLTSGWGMGFQQLSVIPMKSLASNVIYAITRGDSLNVYDGGFGVSKIVSEFGVFGIGMTLYFAVLASRLALRLRKAALGKAAPNLSMIAPYSFIVGFAVEMFVRGVGYFSGTVFMLVVAYLFLEFRRDRTRLSAPVTQDREQFA